MTTHGFTIDGNVGNNGIPPLTSKKWLGATFDPLVQISSKHSTNKEDWREKKDMEKIRWRREWYEFTQSTTCHGVNKITQETPFTARRYGRKVIIVRKRKKSNWSRN